MAAKDAVKKLRLSLGLEQNEFAKILGVTAGTICNWEREYRHPRLPKIRIMMELAKKNKIKMTIEEFY